MFTRFLINPISHLIYFSSGIKKSPLSLTLFMTKGFSIFMRVLTVSAIEINLSKLGGCLDPDSPWYAPISELLISVLTKHKKYQCELKIIR